MAKIMIADDSDSVRQILQDIAVVGQHEVIAQAKDGQETIDVFLSKKPDVLLLDLAMPKKHGLTVVEEIIAAVPNAKIIIVTASDDQKTISQCLEKGAVGYIAKPFDFEKVLQEINSNLEK